MWAGPLSTGKTVVVLFNKGIEAETVTADREAMGLPEGDAAVPVRDLLARKAAPPLAAGAPLSASVPPHGALGQPGH